MKDIYDLGKNRISLEDIEKFYRINDYQNLYEVVIDLINSNKIIPIKRSELNGKRPSLYKNYKLVNNSNEEQKLRYNKYENEIKYGLNTKLSIDYYIKHLDKYEEERENILKLSKFLNDKTYLNNKISINERSFEIFGREKFLLKEGGVKLLSNLGLVPEDLNIYYTTEPISYYSNTKDTPQNILILENKDTFYSMRKHLINGNSLIFGISVGSLIYGGGKGIVKSFNDFEYCLEPYLTHRDNKLLYFGDLDFEGIKIYEALKKKYGNRLNLCSFTEAYVKMIEKYEKYNIDLPFTKDGQRDNIDDIFINEFDNKNKTKILDILDSRRYIPQEILNISDF